MKAWPSILSTDGVSILIVVQETDVHSNQRCSIDCYNLASDDTRPSATRRVEGNKLQTRGGWERHWLQKLGCALFPDRQNPSDIRVTADSWKRSHTSPKDWFEKAFSREDNTHTLSWTVGIGRMCSSLLRYFRVLFTLPLNGTAKVSLMLAAALGSDGLWKERMKPHSLLLGIGHCCLLEKSWTNVIRQQWDTRASLNFRKLYR